MDGLGVSFMRAWGAKRQSPKQQDPKPQKPKASKKEKGKKDEPKNEEPEKKNPKDEQTKDSQANATQTKVTQPKDNPTKEKSKKDKPQPNPPMPLYMPRDNTHLLCSSELSLTPSDEEVEKNLREFAKWKKKIEDEYASKRAAAAAEAAESAESATKDELTPMAKSPSTNNSAPKIPRAVLRASRDLSDLSQKLLPTQVPTPQQQQQSPPSTPQKSALRKTAPEQKTPRCHVRFATHPRFHRNTTSPEVRDKARLFAQDARNKPPPDLNMHPALRPQNVRKRKKEHPAQTNQPKCWRPARRFGRGSDDQLRACCRSRGVVNICEDCGYVLCKTCDSRCRGREWCVVDDCTRCQTRRGVNLCSPHLEQLRNRPLERFYGHVVEPRTLALIKTM